MGNKSIVFLIRSIIILKKGLPFFGSPFPNEKKLFKISLAKLF